MNKNPKIEKISSSVVLNDELEDTMTQRRKAAHRAIDGTSSFVLLCLDVNDDKLTGYNNILIPGDLNKVEIVYMLEFYKNILLNNSFDSLDNDELLPEEDKERWLY